MPLYLPPNSYYQQESLLLPEYTKDPTDEKEIRTIAKEGGVVPVVFGTVRLGGNIIYMSNITLWSAPDEIYSADIWQALCFGKIELQYFIGNGTEIKTATWAEVQATNPAIAENFNDGTEAYFPPTVFDQFGVEILQQYQSKLSGVAHIFFSVWSMFRYWNFIHSEDKTLNQLHYIVKRILTTGLNHDDVQGGTGANPAAVIYDILTNKQWGAGIDPANINLSSFNDASDEYFNQGLGLSMVLDEPKKTSEHIQRVCDLADCYIARNPSGEYYIRRKAITDPVVVSLVDEDYSDFNLTRQSWEDLPTILKAKYRWLADTEYQQVILSVTNSAALEYVGSDRAKMVDLEGIDNGALYDASIRLYAIMEIETYPFTIINIIGNLSLSIVKLLDIIQITNVEQNMDIPQKFRVVQKTDDVRGSNKIKLVLEQVSAVIFEDTAETVRYRAAQPLGPPPDYYPPLS